MRILKLLLANAAVLFSAIWYGATIASEPFFRGLGDLSGANFHSEAFGVSADGSVVVGRSNSTRSSLRGEAFRWTQAGGMIGLGDLPGADFGSHANGVSDDGSVVVGWSLSTVGCSRGAGCRSLPGAFRWTSADGMTLLGDDEHGSRGIAYGVSADGSVVVGTRSGRGIPGGAFRWTPDRVIEYLAPGGTAHGVSPDGAVAVGFGSFPGLGVQALRWTIGGGTLPLGNGTPYGVSADGSVVVGFGTANEAFRWTQASGMVGLGILSGFNASLARNVSADGSLVVGYSGDDWITPREAFLWDATHGMRSLREVLINDFGLGASLAGWTLTSANDISADGQFIVGNGTNPSGNTEAWIARLQVAPTLPGDFNHDGTVDASDYVVWRKGLGTVYSQNDYNTWRAHFGENMGATGSASASAEPRLATIPEPVSIALAAAGFVCWIAWPRRRKRHPRNVGPQCYDVAHVRGDAATSGH